MDTIIISDDEEPTMGRRPDPRLRHPAYRQYAEAPRTRPYDEVADEEELLAGSEEEDMDVLCLDSSDEEGNHEGPPPTPRWQHEEYVISSEEEGQDDGDDDDEEFAYLQGDDESMPERPPTPQFREHTPEPPAYRTGVSRGQAYQEMHCRRVISDGQREFREWTATFMTEVVRPTDRTVAVLPTQERPSLEPVVEFPPDTDPQDDPPRSTASEHTQVKRPTRRPYRAVPREQWPAKIQQEVDEAVQKSRTGRVRFCRFAEGKQYLVQIYKDRVAVEVRPRK